MTRLYLASFFDTRERLYPIRDQLQTFGYEVTSRWLDEVPGAAFATSSAEYLRACAVRGLEDIKRSNGFILDTFDTSPRGGQEVEWGLALSRMEMQRFVVGPIRNVFHHLAQQRFETWEEALAWFDLFKPQRLV